MCCNCFINDRCRVILSVDVDTKRNNNIWRLQSLRIQYSRSVFTVNKLYNVIRLHCKSACTRCKYVKYKPESKSIPSFIG